MCLFMCCMRNNCGRAYASTGHHHMHLACTPPCTHACTNAAQLTPTLKTDPSHTHIILSHTLLPHFSASLQQYTITLDAHQTRSEWVDMDMEVEQRLNRGYEAVSTVGAGWLGVVQAFMQMAWTGCMPACSIAESIPLGKDAFKP